MSSPPGRFSGAWARASPRALSASRRPGRRRWSRRPWPWRAAGATSPSGCTASRDLVLAARSRRRRGPRLAGPGVGGEAAVRLPRGAAAERGRLRPGHSRPRHVARRRSSGLLRPRVGVEALLASRSLAGSLRRTSVLVGALATAIAMTVGGHHGGELPPDRPRLARTARSPPTSTSPGGLRAPQPPGSPRRLPSDRAAAGGRRGGPLPGLRDQLRGLPATWRPSTRVQRAARRPRLPLRPPGAEVLRGLSGGDTVIVSEPFASKHAVRPGDVSPCRSAARGVPRVLDVYYDYASERGYIMLDREPLLRYLPTPRPRRRSPSTSAGTDIAQARAAVTGDAGYRVGIVTNASCGGRRCRLRPHVRDHLCPGSRCDLRRRHRDRRARCSRS